MYVFVAWAILWFIQYSMNSQELVPTPSEKPISYSCCDCFKHVSLCLLASKSSLVTL